MRSAVAVASPLVAVACLLASPGFAVAGETTTKPLPGCSIEAAPRDPWAIAFGDAAPAQPRPPLLRSSVSDGQAAPGRRPLPVEYSDFYKTRAKIHKYASIATLPIFVANYLAGQDLYNNSGEESNKGLHVGLATGTAVLFGVNTVTGAWNLWEGRKDSNHRTRRFTHGILMMAADVGFLATAMLAPEGDEGEHEQLHSTESEGSHNASTHRAVALTSMGIAAVSYLIMLLGGN